MGHGVSTSGGSSLDHLAKGRNFVKADSDSNSYPSTIEHTRLEKGSDSSFWSQESTASPHRFLRVHCWKFGIGRFADHCT